MYFVIFKGSLGKKIVLVDEEGLDSISRSFDQDKHYKFLSYDPNDMNQPRSCIAMKHGSVYEYEVRSERDFDGKDNTVQSNRL